MNAHSHLSDIKHRCAILAVEVDKLVLGSAEEHRHRIAERLDV